MSERVTECPTCGAGTDLNADVLYSIDRVLMWKKQDPEHAPIYDAAIAELRALRAIGVEVEDGPTDRRDG